MRVLLLASAIAFAGHVLPAGAAGEHSGPNHEWVHNLHSPAGAWCCDEADGVMDPDWMITGEGYSVIISGELIAVPPDAVITEPNRVGRAIVWPMYVGGKMSVRCFLPGAAS